jgi:hypothetical protein
VIRIFHRLHQHYLRLRFTKASYSNAALFSSFLDRRRLTPEGDEPLIGHVMPGFNIATGNSTTDPTICRRRLW